MTEAFRAEVTLAAPSGQAWTALTDLANAPAWMSGIDSMTVSGDLQLGAVVTFHTRGKVRTSTITVFESGHSMTLRSVQGAVTADYAYRIDELTAATSRVILMVEVTASGAMRMLGPIIRSAITKADGEQLTRFKNFIEGTGTVLPEPSPS